MQVFAHTCGEEYSSWLLPAVDLAVESAKNTLAEVDLFAAASGPGSFTGVRIGLTTVKAWSEVFNKPIVTVSRLEAVAVRSRRETPYVASFIDAQRGQIFGALYWRHEQGLTLIEQEVVSLPEVFVNWVSERVAAVDVAWISTDANIVAQHSVWQGRSAQAKTIEQVPCILAPLIGKMAFRRALEGKVLEALSVDANYVRRSYVEVFQKGPADVPASEPQLSATPLKVRPYQPRDSEAVYEICRQSPEAAQWTRESYDQAHSSEQIVLIAERGDQVWGFLVARITGDEAEILNTAVDPRHRRKGIGSLLLRTAISEVQAHNVKSIYLEVRESNFAGIALYGHHGFAKTAQRHAYYSGPTEDAVVMKKITA